MKNLFKPIPKEELVGQTTETKNWAGMFISIFVIFLICASIVTVAVIVSDRYYLDKEFDFEDIFNDSFKEKQFHFQWLNGSHHVGLDKEKNIYQYDMVRKITTVLLDSRTWYIHGISDYTVSPDGYFILLACNKIDLYESSFMAIYKVYDVKHKKIHSTLKPSNITEESPLLRYANWSPNKTMLALLFIYDNDIYYQESLSSDPKQITFSGEENIILNGFPDLVHEVEIEPSNNAIYWFEGGTSFVYASFNETGVHQSWITKYDYMDDPKPQYFPYPKPGGRLPEVTLKVVDLADALKPSVTDLIPPKEIAATEYFYKYVVWINRFQVSITWINRDQTFCVISICGVDNGICNSSLEQRTDNGWVVLRGAPLFSGTASSYAVIWQLRDVDGSDTHYHVHVVTVKDEKRPLTTEGQFEVFKIVEYNKAQSTVYYIANMDATWNRHLYRVTMSMNGKFEPVCLSCHIEGIDDNCTFYDAETVPDSSKYVLHCRGPGIPRSTLHDFNEGGYTILQNNTELFAALYGKVHLVQKSHLFNIGTLKIPVRIMHHSMKDKNRKHPLLINVINKPESQSVTSEFQQGWYTYLASRYYVIVVNIDTRGTIGSGQKFMYPIYKNLGTVEVDDLIAVTEFIRNSSLGVVSFEETQFDQNRVGLIGWSYGGFIASLAHAKSTFFNCSLAVTPITDWRFYDAVFSEKYMGLPSATDNKQGYLNANVSSYASLFRNNTYSVVHGMADNVVHFQHSANMVKALAKENIQHQTMFYPDQNHKFTESDIKKNVYRAMTDFLVQCLDLESVV